MATVCVKVLNVLSVAADVTETVKLFHTWAAATWKAPSLTMGRRVDGTPRRLERVGMVADRSRRSVTRGETYHEQQAVVFDCLDRHQWNSWLYGIKQSISRLLLIGLPNRPIYIVQVDTQLKSGAATNALSQLSWCRPDNFFSLFLNTACEMSAARSSTGRLFQIVRPCPESPVENNCWNKLLKFV